jgi:hypothetical protein
MTHAAVRIAAACLTAAVLAGPVAGMAAPMVRPAPAGDAGSRVPGYPDVVAEYIQVPGGKAPGTPVALNTASFLRLRASADGDRPRPANAVVVGLPGFSSTPPHWLYLSSQMVSRAAKQTCDGQPCRLEVWVLQRRGANLAETEALTEAPTEAPTEAQTESLTEAPTEAQTEALTIPWLKGDPHQTVPLPKRSRQGHPAIEGVAHPPLTKREPGAPSEGAETMPRAPQRGGRGRTSAPGAPTGRRYGRLLSCTLAMHCLSTTTST